MRTLVDIPKADRAWLDHEAQKEGVSMAEMVRQAIKTLKSIRQSRHTERMLLLKSLQGTWKKGDGLKWQNKLRAEWER